MADAEVGHTHRQGYRPNVVEPSAGPLAFPLGKPTEGDSTASPTPRTAVGSLVAEPERRTAQPQQSFPVHKAARAVLNVYRGANVTDALVATGIPRATWYQWLRPSDQWPTGELLSAEAKTFAARLRHAFERAQGLCALQMQQTMRRAAKNRVGELDWRAAHEHLKHADATRARWREHRELRIEHAGAIGHEHRLVAQMSEAEVIDLLPTEWRDLLEPPRLP